METMIPAGVVRYRVWIVACRGQRPAHWSETPVVATALEPADDILYTRDEVARFVEGFNRAIISAASDADEQSGNRDESAGVRSREEDRLWAVAVPIRASYEGDVAAGMPVHGVALSCVPTGK